MNPEPGEVWIVRYGEQERQAVYSYGNRWWFTDRGLWALASALVTPLRRVVALDPENGDADRLYDLYRQHTGVVDNTGNRRGMREALRAYTKSKPPEPKAQWAVVRDRDGDEWVRAVASPVAPWLKAGSFTAEEWTNYSDIDAVEVVRE